MEQNIAFVSRVNIEQSNISAVMVGLSWEGEGILAWVDVLVEVHVQAFISFLKKTFCVQFLGLQIKLRDKSKLFLLLSKKSKSCFCAF